MKKETIAEILARAPKVTEAYDTSTEQFDHFVLWLDTYLRTQRVSIANTDKALRSIDTDLDTIIGARTALKVVQGRHDAQWVEAYAAQQSQSVVVTFIMPIYHEAARMHPRSADNPHGENALLYKLAYLETIKREFPHIIPRLLLVDDGCDGKDPMHETSGHAAEKLLRSFRLAHGSAIDNKVIYLEKAIAAQSKLLPASIEDPRQSMKGGAVIYALNYAQRAWRTDLGARHILVVSDADLSVHPGHTPSFVRAILEQNCLVATGSRFETASVQAIQADRKGPGELYAEVWRKLLPTLAASSQDASRGFLAIDASFVPTIHAGIQVYSFTYQTELLLLAAEQGAEKLRSVAVAYIDSSALSNFQDDSLPQTYFQQAQVVNDIARKHHEPSPPALRAAIDKAGRDPEAAEAWWWHTAKSDCSVEQLMATIPQGVAH